MDQRSAIEPFGELRASLERLRGLLQTQERQFADIEARSPPVSAARVAARRLMALLRPWPHVSQRTSEQVRM